MVYRRELLTKFSFETLILKHVSIWYFAQFDKCFLGDCQSKCILPWWLTTDFLCASAVPFRHRHTIYRCFQYVLDDVSSDRDRTYLLVGVTSQMMFVLKLLNWRSDQRICGRLKIRTTFNIMYISLKPYQLANIRKASMAFSVNRL